MEAWTQRGILLFIPWCCERVSGGDAPGEADASWQQGGDAVPEGPAPPGGPFAPRPAFPLSFPENLKCQLCFLASLLGMLFPHLSLSFLVFVARGGAMWRAVCAKRREPCCTGGP